MRLNDRASDARLGCRSVFLLLLIAASLTLTSCASLGKRGTQRFVVPAGCGERAIALRPTPPPESTDWRVWALAYIRAMSAYEDSENKRSSTAECLDRHRSGQ